MNFNLTQMPERLVKPRKEGLTMVMDKGLTFEEARISSSLGLVPPMSHPGYVIRLNYINKQASRFISAGHSWKPF
jgi:hypothetical protein